ncbi:MAG: VCBS repeat-containing protein [Planctomycetota bacterium]|nr:VCBS repeat-containing protein [Planctomycetota bacterium]
MRIGALLWSVAGVIILGLLVPISCGGGGGGGKKSSAIYTLTIVAGPNGTMTPASGDFDGGTVVMLTASPSPTNRVAAWTGTDDDASTATTGTNIPTTNQVTMNADKTVNVTFEVLPTQYTLTQSPGANGALMPPTGLYDAGFALPLRAWGAAGYEVASWSGTDDDLSTAFTNTVTMTTDRTVSAGFSLTTFTEIQFTAPPGFLPSPHTCLLIDLDDDNDLDLFAANFEWPPAASTVTAFRNDGNGNFTDDTNQIFAGQTIWTTHMRHWAVADFNKDGRDDVFIADHGLDIPPFPGIQNQIFIQNTSGQLIEESATRLPQASDFTHNVAVGDIEGDGDDDLYLANLPSPGPRMLVNDGSGFFSIQNSRIPGGLGGFMSSQFVDVDRDGDLDLVLGQIQGGGGTHDRILLNNGSGNFSTAAQSTLPPRPGGSQNGTVAVDSADYDGDGWQDLVFSNVDNMYTNGSLQLLINNRDGTFRDESTAINKSWRTTGWVVWAHAMDANGDGIPDIVGVANWPLIHTVLEQTGPTGLSLNPAQTYDTQSGAPPVLIPGDVDGDGDIDFVQLTAGNPQRVLLRD